MTTPAALARGDSPLLFNWSPSRRRKVALGSFLVVSIVLHALGFYIFQIVYPPAAALLPPPGRVSVISPASEEGRVLLRWVEAEDPALALTTQRPPDARTFQPPKVPHVASYLTHEPQLRMPPPFVPDLRPPESQPPSPVTPPHPPIRAVAAPVRSTAIEFSPEAAALGASHLPEMKFTRSINDTPQTAQFRVGISPSGEVRFCFLRNPSGDPGLDEQARHYLSLCRFAGAEAATMPAENLLWTTATVMWGNDIASPAASPAPRASP
ncbi:MAG: hypothetical protein ACJ8KU_01180 [Chthoniobacterales bacterium]